MGYPHKKELSNSVKCKTFEFANLISISILTMAPYKLRTTKDQNDLKLSKIGQYLVLEISNLLCPLNVYGPCITYSNLHCKMFVV